VAPEPAGQDGWAPGPGAAVDEVVPEAVAAAPVPAGVAAAPRQRADHGAAARMFETATARRRSVVFEEDDELDVPDFLK
jgi:cell division protein FtsZ